MFAANPLEFKAEELAILLRAGLEEEFVRQFQLVAGSISDRETDALVVLINNQLATGARRKQLKVVVANNDSRKTITVIDRSRLFGSGWPVTRQTFAV